MPKPGQFDAAVVGSGPNGLAAAIEIARAGFSVIVLEAASDIGGGMRSEAATLPGFVHDACSAIHPLGVGSPYLRELPLDRHGLEWIHPPVPLAHPLEGREPVLLHRSIDETGRTLGEDARAYREWFEPLARRWDDLADGLLGPPGIPRHPWLLARFARWGLGPAATVARRRFRGAPARALFAGLAAHSVLPLESRPSASIGIVLGVAGHAVGWPFPRGGAGKLAAAMASYLRSLGGVIRTGEHVESYREVPTSGPVLLDVAPRNLIRIVGGDLPLRYRRQLARFRHAPGVCKIDWALREPIPWTEPACAEAATVHVGGTLEQIAEAEREPWSGRCAERPFVLLAQHSLFDGSRAPAGRHTAWAYCHVPHGSEADRTAAIENQIERHAPGFRDVVLARSVRTAVAMEAYNPNYVGGDITGGAPTLRQILCRPTASRNPYATPNPRVFLCSSSTPPGGGVHGMCGFHAARAALAQLRRTRRSAV